jgi:hypothetical protein
MTTQSPNADAGGAMARTGTALPLTPVHQAVLRVLQTKGTVRLQALAADVAVQLRMSTRDAVEAIWDLVQEDYLTYDANAFLTRRDS